MRTIRRQAHVLNLGKAASLRSLVEAFANEKRFWLDRFARKDHRHLVGQHRVVRDAAMKDGHVPKSGLQARMWKLALVEAAQTWDKFWQAMFVEARRRIAARIDFDEVDRHYAFWLLAGYNQFFACLDGVAAKPKFAIDERRRQKIGHFIRRTIRRLRGRNPMVRTARSAVFDANCYSVFEHNGVQYIKLMGLERGQRIVVPLMGHTAISGNLRLVIDATLGAQIHLGYSLKGAKPSSAKSAEIIALDTGYTEAFVDTKGTHYGKGLGAAISKASEERHTVGKARNKLRDLAKRCDPAKASRIQKFNLGKTKWQRRERKARATIDCIINTSINQVVETHPGATLVTEDLRHAFKMDKPKAWNRRLSAWVRGTLQDRIEFKAAAEGFRHVHVNAAYSSQECPSCGFVDSGNRKGDRFVCLHCGHKDHADRVGALNTESRLTDREITRFTPYREVKVILLSRFHRRLEAKGESVAPRATVPGRTPDIAPRPVHGPAST